MASGHRVLWYAAPQYASHIARVGAEHVPFHEADGFAGGGLSSHVARGIADGLGVVRRLYTEVLVGQAAAQVRDLEELLRTQHVDVLLTDTLMMAGGLVAARQGIPWATLGDGPLLWRDADTPPFGTGLPPLPGERGRRRNEMVQRGVDRTLFAAPLRAYNQVRSELGLAPVDNLQAAGLSGELHLQGCSPGFEYPRASLPDHVRFIGALGPGPGFAPAPPLELARAHRTRPLAFVTQGTLRGDVGELALPAAHVLAHEGFDVLVPVGHHLDAIRHHTFRGDGRVALVDAVDYPAALAEADLFVTNGGYTGVTLALAAGVPVLQAGATEEKPDIGARLEWAGVGRSIRRTPPGPHRIRAAVRSLMDSPERADASRRLAEEMARFDARALGPALLRQLADAHPA